MPRRRSTPETRSTRAPEPRGRAQAHAVVFVLASLALSGLGSRHARADELRSPGDLDGWYLTLGPVAAAAHVDQGWVSAVGGEISIAHLAEGRIPAVLGICGGGVSYGSLPGGRLWLEGEVGLGRPLPFVVGLAVGAAAQVDRTNPPRLGIQATLWAVGGIVPYVRVGTVEVNGAYLEAGIMLKVPVRFAY